MAAEKNQKNHNNSNSESIITHVFWIGLFGGVFWSFIGYMAHLLNFTDIRLNVILEPWALGGWKKQWQGTFISIIVIGMISVGAAFIYYALMKKLKGFWSGIIFGLVIFFLVFFVLNPLFPSIGPLNKLSRDTIITSLCLYIIYGLFIGYSISYQYQFYQTVSNESAT